MLLIDLRCILTASFTRVSLLLGVERRIGSMDQALGTEQGRELARGACISVALQSLNQQHI